MKFSRRQLIKYCHHLPDDEAELRLLFDDLGLEVKNITKTNSDSIITIEILANRGDHLCYTGVAQEICSRTKTKLNYPAINNFELPSYSTSIQVRVDSPHCFSYSLTHVLLKGSVNQSLGESANDILQSMTALTDNSLINISNLVNYEIGQPLHIFDGLKVNGDIVVRESIKGEKAFPLFFKDEIELPEGTLVISDQIKILAIAGVIGCEESKLDENTREILIESAIFDPVSIRKSSKELAIHTDSVARFQKGGDLDLVLTANNLALTYLDQIGILDQIKGFYFQDKECISQRVISIDKRDLEHFFSREFSTAEIVEILESYGFNHKGNLSFKVPMARIWDVEDHIDLYEEIARHIGYNAFDYNLPNIEIGSLPSEVEELVRKTNEVLVGAGFFEVFTSSFYSKEDFMKLSLNKSNPLYEHLEIVNYIDKGHSLMKNNCLLQAMEAVSLNNRFKEHNIKLFEWAKIFHPAKNAPDRESNEKDVFWGCVCGKMCDHFWKNGFNWQADIYFLKGLVEEIAFVNRIELKFQEIPSSVPEYELLHPLKQFSILKGSKRIGFLGEIHPDIVKLFKVKSLKPCYFEIYRDSLFEKIVPLSFTPPPIIPDIRRSLALRVPLEFQLSKIIEYIEKNSIAFFKRVTVKDQYFPPKENYIVYTFELFLDGEKKLSTEDINHYLLKLIDNIVEEFGSKGVQTR